ncbi:MAG: SPOR domain-containing protein [Pseudomonadota bacterium]
MTRFAATAPGLIPALLATLLVLSAGTTHADPLDDARAAWRRGDYKLALDLLRPLSDAGDAGAQATLALMYEFGQGVERSAGTAAELYEQAAPGMDLEFRHNLATKFYAGDGLAQDYGKAARWWREAADGGLPESQYDLGLLYHTGKGLPQDYGKAYELYQAAARRGLARAEHGLGVLYATGNGVPRDYAEAASWFARAAEQNYPKAQYNLASLLMSGRGVDVDTDRAEDLLRRAAAAGEEGAVVKLAELRRQRREPSESSVSTTTTAGAVRTARPANVVAPPIEPRDAIAEPAPVARVVRSSPTPTPPPTTPAPAPTAVPAQSAPAMVSAASDFEEASPQAWVLQLASMSTAQTAEGFADKLRAQLDDTLYVVAYQAGGTVRYAVVLGLFDGRAAAGEAATAVRPLLASGDPWLRRVGALQALQP